MPTSLTKDEMPSVLKRRVFSRVFGPTESTKRVYSAIAAPIVEASLSGYNGTFFAYGQTGAGKTYSLFGEHADGKLDAATATTRGGSLSDHAGTVRHARALGERGIAEMALRDLFERGERRATHDQLIRMT